jgi:hypothetical protein
MSYVIAQDYEYIGRDYWKWWAWIEADDEELDRVDEVVWILHPSFSVPRVTCRDRANKFRLDTSGWGTFRLHAEIHDKNGEMQRVSRNLLLEYPATRSAPAESAPSKTSKRPVPSRGLDAAPARKSPTVFVSYGTEDTPVISPWLDALRKGGLNVVTAKQASPGEPLQDAVARMIRSSDVVLGYLNPEYASPWVVAELQGATRAEKPVLAITGSPSDTAGLPTSVQQIPLDRVRNDTSVLLDSIQSRLREDG